MLPVTSFVSLSSFLNNGCQLTPVERIKTHALTCEKPFVLGLPTGSSPKLVYKLLIEEHNAGNISFKNVITFNMVRLSHLYEIQQLPSESV